MDIHSKLTNNYLQLCQFILHHQLCYLRYDHDYNKESIKGMILHISPVEPFMYQLIMHIAGSSFAQQGMNHDEE